MDVTMPAEVFEEMVRVLRIVQAKRQAGLHLRGLASDALKLLDELDRCACGDGVTRLVGKGEGPGF